MVKNYMIPTILWLLPLLCLSQEPQNPYKFTLTGFVRADALFDSRQAVEAREGFLLFYPKQSVFDAEGNDINSKASFNQYTMSSRLGAKVNGPDLLGAKAFALIEGDFTGASNAENNSMRLRHAYISLQWKTTRLLLGQYWHPLDVPEMIPAVLALNTGAPFHSFSRQPQVRVDQKIGKLNVVGVASSQRDYVNNGPDGNSSVYLRNSAIPNLHAQMQYKHNWLFGGAGIDYKQLLPRLITEKNFISNESVNCLSYILFANAKPGFLNIKAQYTLNHALNDHLMMGGFGVSAIDQETDRRTYEPLEWHAAWINISYTKSNWQPSVFAGYTVDKTEEGLINGPVYARNADIDHVYRIAPMITYIEKKFSLCCELEYTVAAYEGNEEELVIVKKKETGMLRVNLAAVYSF
jgi:hypothetical protein